MDELNDLVAEAKSLIDEMRKRAYDLERALNAAEALLAKWADEEGRLADREG